MLPHLTIYTDRFMADWVGARAIMFLVLIRPKYKDDKGIHAHEYTHVKQWYRWGGLWALLVTIALFIFPDSVQVIVPFYALSICLFPLMYVVIPSFRLEAEAEAYAAQVNAGADINDMAHRLASPNYKLDISDEEAAMLLLEYLE